MRDYNRTVKSLRPLMTLGLLITIAMFSTAMYMQHVMYLDPCPLCIITRIIVIVLAVLFFIGLIVNPIGLGKRFLGLLFTLASLTAVFVSGRHSWLQHYPPEVEVSCGGGLYYWVDTLPIAEVFQNVFRGTAECSAISWEFLTLSIPEWSLVIFLGFLFFSLRLLIKGR